MSSNLSVSVTTKQQAQNHAVIILASGLSQRLGQAKQLLNKNGEPLICYMTKLALATKPKAIFLVIPANNPLVAAAIAELVVHYPIIQTVGNLTPEAGMAHSLYLGMEALNRLPSLSIHRVLIMGIDQILLDEQHITELLAAKLRVVASGYRSWQNLDDTVLNKIPAANKSTQAIAGLPLVIDCALLKQWQALLVGDKGLRYLIRSLPPSQITTVSNNQLSYDIDTPAQLAYAKQNSWLDE